jgi:hypothetical protein
VAASVDPAAAVVAAAAIDETDSERLHRAGRGRTGRACPVTDEPS